MISTYQSVVLLALFSLYTVVNGQNVSKECNKKHADSCGARLIMLGDRTFTFPETIDQMNKRCKEIKPLEKCLKVHSSKCLSEAARSPVSVFAFSITRTNKGYCSSNKRKNAFIAFGNCANTNKQQLDLYMDKLISEFTAINSYKDPKLRIPLVCCSYSTMKTNILNHITEKCQQHHDEIQLLLDGYTQDILNLVCGDYTDESDKCASIVNKTPKYKGNNLTKSLIPPLGDIFENL